jgi:hypothetical protein
VSYLERLRTLKRPPAATDENARNGFSSFPSAAAPPVSERNTGAAPGSARHRLLAGEAVRGLPLSARQLLSSLAPADWEALRSGELTADALRAYALRLSERVARDRVERFYRDLFAGQAGRALVSLDQAQRSRAVRLGLLTRARAEGHQVLAYRSGRASCLLLIPADRYDAVGLLGVLHGPAPAAGAAAPQPSRLARQTSTNPGDQS